MEQTGTYFAPRHCLSFHSRSVTDAYSPVSCFSIASDSMEKWRGRLKGLFIPALNRELYMSKGSQQKRVRKLHIVQK